jgi:arylsulfatase A-like enzyme
MQRSHGLTRREFLKLISLAPVGIYSRPLAKLKAVANPDRPNIIVIVFDAWSQHHLSMYGYPRNTMPNLEAFAEKATVYHNHYATATFTTPGTSSLLSGLYPWSHRAIQLGAGLAPVHAGHTIFSALGATHSTLAFTQNKYADQILLQGQDYLDRHIPNWEFNIQKIDLYDASIFNKDAQLAFASIEDNVIKRGAGTDGSLFLGPFYRLHILNRVLRNTQKYGSDYPRGLPGALETFLLPDVVEGAIGLLRGLEQPSVTYIHFYPPHEPYAPTKHFFDSFKNDGWMPAQKPIHELSETKYTFEQLQLEHRYYDEFLASWDHEVKRLFDYLQQSGLTENSYIFITSDHGEMFERGELGHWTKMIYDPVIHVPLIVHSPGQSGRQDVHTATSNVDLLPTIVQLTEHPIPDWTEGKPLPNLGGQAEAGRTVFSMDAKMNSSFAPLRNYSMSLTREGHRLTRYSYPKDNYEKYEFYDLEDDPQELKDLYPAKPFLTLEMQEELEQKVHEVNKPFERDGL